MSAELNNPADEAPKLPYQWGSEDKPYRGPQLTDDEFGELLSVLEGKTVSQSDLWYREQEISRGHSSAWLRGKLRENFGTVTLEEVVYRAVINRTVFVNTKAQNLPAFKLSKWQTELLQDVAQGKGKFYMARQRGLSGNKLERQVTTIMHIVGAFDKPQMIYKAFEQGILKVPDTEPE